MIIIISLRENKNPNFIERLLRQRYVQTNKILIIGENIRKTRNPFFQLVTGKFSKSFFDTIGVDTYSKEVIINRKKVVLSLWNICIEKKFEPIYNLSLLGSRIVLLLYEIGDLDSLKLIENWFRDTVNHLDSKAFVFIIGQKTKESQENTHEMENILKEMMSTGRVYGHLKVNRNDVSKYEEIINELAVLSIHGFYIFSSIIDIELKIKYLTKVIFSTSGIIKSISPPLESPEEIIKAGNTKRKITFDGIPGEFDVDTIELINALYNEKVEELRDKLLWKSIWKDYIQMLLDRLKVDYEFVEKDLVKIKGKHNTYFISAISGRATTKNGKNLLCIVPKHELKAVISDPLIERLYNVPFIRLTGKDALFVSIVYSLANDSIIKDEVLLSQIKEH